MGSKVKSAFGGKKIGVLGAIVVATLVVSSFVVISLVAGQNPRPCVVDGFCDQAGLGENSVNCPDDCYCGNGIIHEGEWCDDGNTDSDDGCSADCMFEWEIDSDPDPRDGICDSGCLDVDYPNCGPGFCKPRWNNMWPRTCGYYDASETCENTEFCNWYSEDPDPGCDVDKSHVNCWRYDYDAGVCNAQPYCYWDTDDVCLSDINAGCEILPQGDCGSGSDACYWDEAVKKCKYVGDEALLGCFDYEGPTCGGYNYCKSPSGCNVDVEFIYFCNEQKDQASCVATGEHCRWDDDVKWCFVYEGAKGSCGSEDDIDPCLEKPYCEWYGLQCTYCVAAEPDNCPPSVTMTELTPNPVAVDTPILLTANVDDSRTGGSIIASAEYNIDAGMTWYPMFAADSDFDSPTEGVTATLSALDLGVYEVCVRGTDAPEDAPGNVGGPECIFLVVYNPEGGLGFVTGGGWIWSPPGAYHNDPTLFGKAIFGFVSKYKKGATTPTGQTQFQFRVADLDFHSDSYEWLVVGGARAQYKGSGTINGAGDYGFMLTAIDAELTPSTEVDKFRIKIWDKATDEGVYDNQPGDSDGAVLTTQIGGGSIVIHKKK